MGKQWFLTWLWTPSWAVPIMEGKKPKVGALLPSPQLVARLIPLAKEGWGQGNPPSFLIPGMEKPPLTAGAQPALLCWNRKHSPGLHNILGCWRNAS